MYWQSPLALIEAGWACGYLNLAARELGYRMHTYSMINLPTRETGEVMYNETCGTWDYIRRGMWDSDQFLYPREGGDPFMHYTMILQREIQAAGNLTLICCNVIGKIDEVDAATGSSALRPWKEGMRYNYDFWE